MRRRTKSVIFIPLYAEKGVIKNKERLYAVAVTVLNFSYSKFAFMYIVKKYYALCFENYHKG